MRIDAHHHFWRYDAAEYGWIDDGMRVIRRDFLPEDLLQTIRPAGVDGVISVQARQSLAETEWLLGMADAHGFIKGVVGWAPLMQDGVEAELEPLAGRRKLRALRHVVQGEPAGFLAREDFNRGVALLAKHGLTYDLLINERQLAETIEFVDRLPKQVFVLDHVAKPQIRRGLIEPWAGEMRELARRANVYCKVSGMVTEADFGKWTAEQLLPYFETVLEAFGPQRLMFGSDWPVCLVAATYVRWIGVVEGFVARLSAGEKKAFWGETACRAYGIGTREITGVRR